MTWSELVRHLSCRLWGHAVDNRAFHDSTFNERRCRCGADYLREDGTFTRVRHTLSCFLRHHTYQRLEDRAGHNEYVCVRCGHPLVFPAAAAMPSTYVAIAGTRSASPTLHSQQASSRSATCRRLRLC